MKKALHKLFFETNMTWKRVIAFAVITAIVTAILLILPITKDTSFANIGVTPECWVLFALIIIMNCEKPLEAGLKTFVFFLISQPLIYLLQVPFNAFGWGIFRYYPYWFFITLLCFPGGMIAWRVKKDDLLSAVILSVATGLLAYLCIYFASSTVRSFPRYLISSLFCAVLAVVLIAALLKNKRGRAIAAAITVLVAAAALTVQIRNAAVAPGTYTSCYLGDDHAWEIVSYEGGMDEVCMDPDVDGAFIVRVTDYCTGSVTLRNETGETVTYRVTYDDNGLELSEE